MKTWLKGGLIGAGLLIILMIIFWVVQSFNFGCVLEPMQSVNVGGPECVFKNYISFQSLVYFLYPFIFGFIIGAIIGLIVQKVKSKK